MKPKSYIEITVPSGESELTTRLLSELSNEMHYLDIRTRESPDGKYRALEAFIHESEAATNMTTVADASGSAAMFSAAHIIYRVTGHYKLTTTEVFAF
jgi:hypothetical protein